MTDNALNNPENKLTELVRLYNSDNFFECEAFFGKTVKLSNDIFVTLRGERFSLTKNECEEAIETFDDGRIWFGFAGSSTYIERSELPARLRSVYDWHQEIVDSIKLL